MIPAPLPLIPDVIRLNGRWRRDRDAVTCGDTTLSWGEFDRRTERVANALVALGLGRGDALAVLMNNGIPMVEAMFGAMKAGVCVVPINLSVSDDGLERMIIDAGSRAVVATPAQRARLEGMRGRLPAIVDGGWICVDGGEGWNDYASWRDTASPDRCPVEPDPVVPEL